MSLATPIRGKVLSSSDMNNESPLPTPPQAMHDLLRNGKVAAAAAAAKSSFGDVAEDSTRRATSHRQSSSPSARAASNGVGRNTVRSSGSSRSPSSLGASSNHLHRSALGSQMGIMQNGINQSSTSTSYIGDMPLKPMRPGALSSSSQRSMSYEASPKRVNEEMARMSTRPSFMSLAASTSTAQSSNYGRESNKENVGTDGVRGHQRRISAVRRISSKRSPSPTSTAVGEPPMHSESDIHRRFSPDNGKKQPLSLGARSLPPKSSEEISVSSRRRPVEGNINVSPRQETHDTDIHLTDEGVGLPGSSQFVTPGFTGNARVLRSGQAPKHSSALWSVGRSMKRIGES